MQNSLRHPRLMNFCSHLFQECINGAVHIFFPATANKKVEINSHSKHSTFSWTPSDCKLLAKNAAKQIRQQSSRRISLCQSIHVSMGSLRNSLIGSKIIRRCSSSSIASRYYRNTVSLSRARCSGSFFFLFISRACVSVDFAWSAITDGCLCGNEARLNGGSHRGSAENLSDVFIINANPARDNSLMCVTCEKSPASDRSLGE